MAWSRSTAVQHRWSIDPGSHLPSEGASIHVLNANSDDFDFIPVIDETSHEPRFVGLFPAAQVRNRAIGDGSVASLYLPLTEEYLIGADASILDFVIQADTRPCRLVVSGSQTGDAV